MCKSCCNRAKSKARYIPVVEWVLSCSRCGKNTSTNRKRKPKSMMCLQCRVDVARGVSNRIRSEAAKHKPQCEHYGCMNKVKGKKNLCFAHWEFKVRTDNPEHHRYVRHQHYLKYKEKIIAHNLARKFAKSHSNPEEKPAMVEFYLLLKTAKELPCYWCGKQTKQGDRHGDHIIPLSRGGTHTLDNLCCSCVSCNTRKRALMPEEFRRILRRVA